MYDVQKIRGDFPILMKGIIYLDNAASSLTPEPVLEKMLDYYRGYRANVSRGIHRFSQQASEEYEKAHSKIADFINARSDLEIVIVKNSTEAMNLVANGLKWKRGDKVVTSILEHHSNFVIWLRAKQKHGLKLDFIKPDEQGLVDLSSVEKIIDDHTRLVSITHVSNTLGTIVPVEEIVKIAHQHGALVMVDGAQSVPELETDVRRIGCDFLAFSGHKMCGPTGSGVLYVREELADQLEPLCVGGGAIEDVGLESFQLKKSPERFEAGTPPIAETIGLGAAVEYLKKIGMKNIENYEEALTKKMFEELTNIPNLKVYGPEPKHRIGITSFNVGDLNSHDVALALDATANIFVRSGHHCALPLMKNVLKADGGTVRASTYIYNTVEEVERLSSTLHEIATSLV